MNIENLDNVDQYTRIFTQDGRVTLNPLSNITLIHSFKIDNGLDDVYWTDTPASYVNGSYVIVGGKYHEYIPVEELPSGDLVEPWTRDTLDLIVSKSVESMVTSELEYEWPGNYVLVLRNIEVTELSSNSPKVRVYGKLHKVSSDPWPDAG